MIPSRFLFLEPVGSKSFEPESRSEWVRTGTRTRVDSDIDSDPNGFRPGLDLECVRTWVQAPVGSNQDSSLNGFRNRRGLECVRTWIRAPVGLELVPFRILPDELYPSAPFPDKTHFFVFRYVSLVKRTTSKAVKRILMLKRNFTKVSKIHLMSQTNI
jgi:hypothetical protein